MPIDCGNVYSAWGYQPDAREMRTMLAHLYRVIIYGVDTIEAKSNTNKHDNCASTPS